MERHLHSPDPSLGDLVTKLFTFYVRSYQPYIAELRANCSNPALFTR